MTQTSQSRSLATLNTEKDLAKNKPEKEDNAKLLLTIYDNLNELYEKLNRLSNVIEKRNAEHNTKGEIYED